MILKSLVFFKRVPFLNSTLQLFRHVKFFTWKWVWLKCLGNDNLLLVEFQPTVGGRLYDIPIFFLSHRNVTRGKEVSRSSFWKLWIIFPSDICLFTIYRPYAVVNIYFTLYHHFRSLFCRSILVPVSLECKRNIIIQEMYNCNMLYCLFS